MCLYPRLIKNKKYTTNKKNGGIIPTVLDERVKYVPIGCQQCIECRKKKAREWQTRLLEDIKQNKNAKFITLTFTNEAIAELTKEIKDLQGYELDNEIATKATRLFLERWRKKNKRSIRHWLVTELGHNGTENIHLHGILWTDKPQEIHDTWQYGYVWYGQKTDGTITNYVSERTINYIIKYVTKIDEQHTGYKSKILTSPGIGANYMQNKNVNRNKYNNENTIETYKTPNGKETALPIYWRNKIYTEQEREKLWLTKLDKEERYILGQKISIKDNDEVYKKTLQNAQAKNKRLGYGDGTKDWQKEQYERDRRILMQKTRIAKANKQHTHPDASPAGSLT